MGHVKGPARLPAAWSTGPGRPYPMICSLYRMCVVELLQVVMFKPALPKCPARQSLALQLPSHLPCAACCGGCGDVQPSLQRLSMGGHGHYSALILRREQRACDEARGVRTRLHTSTLHEHQGSTGLAKCIWSSGTCCWRGSTQEPHAWMLSLRAPRALPMAVLHKLHLLLLWQQLTCAGYSGCVVVELGVQWRLPGQRDQQVEDHAEDCHWDGASWNCHAAAGGQPMSVRRGAQMAR